MVQVFLLIFSLSIDSFMAGFSLGMNRIFISFKYLILLNGISSFFLFLSIFFGFYFQNQLSVQTTHILSLILFLILGIEKILESIFHKITQNEKEIKIRLSKLEFIFHIYANPEISDFDCSKQISCIEALFLGLALSLDNLVIGLGIGLLNMPFIYVIICSFLIGTFLLTIGNFIGKKVCKNCKFESSWISGIILVVLAFLKIRS